MICFTHIRRQSDDDMAMDGQAGVNSESGDEENEEVQAEEEVPEANLEEPDKNLEDQFNEICEKIIHDPNADATLRKNLTMFADGIRNTRNAEKKVEEAYIATEKVLEKSKTTILESAVPLYEYLSNYLDQMESEILAHFSESHELRKSILGKFDILNTSWKQTCSDLMKRLVPGHQQSAIATPGLSTIAEVDNEDGHEDDGAEIKVEADSSNDLDWDKIISLAPTLKDCVQKFLAAREQWTSAVECFHKALDSAEEKICKRQQHMLEILANAHRTIYDNLAESQERLMRLYVENHVKREALEKHLQRKASQQTKFFQRLMQSVKGTGTSKPVSSTNAATVIQKPSVRKPLSTIRNAFKRGKGQKRAAESQDAPTDE
jgi:uncharacterized membrane-anchored protein YhcB (DUF1043 family)